MLLKQMKHIEFNEFLDIMRNGNKETESKQEYIDMSEEECLKFLNEKFGGGNNE